MDAFDATHLKIFLYEDFKDAPSLLKNCFDFLCVRSDISIDTGTKYNMSGKVKSQYWYNFFDKPNVLKEVVKPFIPKGLSRKIGEKAKAMTMAQENLDSAIRQQLVNDYRDDIIKLQGLIKRDLSDWIK